MLKHLSAPAARPPMDVLVAVDRRVAMEAEVLTNFSNSVSNMVNNITNSVGSFFAGLSYAETPAGRKGEYTYFLNKMDRVKYVDIMSKKFYVPEGFSGDLAAYAEHLATHTEHAGKIATDILDPFNDFLAGILSNPASVKQVRSSLPQVFKSNQIRERLNKDIAPFFKHGSTASESTVGDVLARNKDWDRVANAMFQAKQNLAQVSPKDIQSKVNTSVDLLNALRKTAKEGTIDGISPESIRTLSESALAVAREAEFYSITTYRLKSLINTFEQSIKEIELGF